VLKSLLILCCLGVALGAVVAVGCGPKNAYCPQNMGPCYAPQPDAGVDMPDVGLGEATIFGLGGSGT
jgi:hypothetical protein